MSDYRYGFVILHYMAQSVTEQCIKSLKALDEAEHSIIVIVDNASPNGSGRSLQKKFEDEQNIKVLLNEKNDGFARGNNTGYEYIKNNCDVDYIIIMNNDVIIEQKDFLRQTDIIYQQKGFAVLGPDIFCPYTGVHQNPSHLHALTQQEVLSHKALLEKKDKHFAFHYYKHHLGGKIKKMIKKNRPVSQMEKKTEYIENPVLHGACYIFSRDFISKREYAFCPETFLYFEEDILHAECTRLGLKMLYSPEITVNHLEDVSTNMRFKSRYKKEKMKNREMLNSINVLMKFTG